MLVMPKMVTDKPMTRVTVPIPEPLIMEIDKIVKQLPMYAWNRQKFIEQSIREKLDRTRQMQSVYYDLEKAHTEL